MLAVRLLGTCVIGAVVLLALQIASMRLDITALQTMSGSQEKNLRLFSEELERLKALAASQNLKVLQKDVTDSQKVSEVAEVAAPDGESPGETGATSMPKEAEPAELPNACRSGQPAGALEFLAAELPFEHTCKSFFEQVDSGGLAQNDVKVGYMTKAVRFMSLFPTCQVRVVRFSVSCALPSFLPSFLRRPSAGLHMQALDRSGPTGPEQQAPDRLSEYISDRMPNRSKWNVR